MAEEKMNQIHLEEEEATQAILSIVRHFTQSNVSPVSKVGYRRKKKKEKKKIRCCTCTFAACFP